MVVQTWGDVIVASFQAMWTGVADFLPIFIGGLVVLIVGLIIAGGLGKLVGKIIRALRIDQILIKMGFREFLSRAGLQLDSGRFIGGLVKWFLVIVFVLATTSIWQLDQVALFLKDIILYIPNIIIAAVIMLVGVWAANVLERIVKASVAASRLGYGNFLGALTRWAILVFALLAALAQLGVATMLITTLVTGFVAMLAIAGGLAFGLGGKEAASRAIERIRQAVSE